MKTRLNSLLGAGVVLIAPLSTTLAAGKGKGGGGSESGATAQIALSAPVVDRKSGQTTYEIFGLDPDGGRARQLTKHGGQWPVWSRDQNYLAYYSRNPLTGIPTIYVQEVKSGDRFPVVEADGSGHDWWPGDSGIVYTDRDRTGIWFVPVDPATRTVGTPYRILDLGLYPRVSPDGSKIAFCRGGVRVFDFDTQTESLIPQSVYAPSWSPDGSKLAFGGVVCYGPGADLDEVHCHSEIVIANPDGTEWTPVTALHSNTSFPTWSPDGSELAFFSAVSGSKALYKTTIGSGVVTLLYEGAEQASDWAP